MCHAIIQLRQLTTVPAVGGTHQITRDTLEFVDVGRAAFRAALQMVVGILVAAVHTTVTVVVHAAIAHVQLVHHIHHAHDYLWVVGGIAVNLHVEDMSATGHLMIGSLNLGLMTG